MKIRQEKLLDAMHQNGLDAALITSGVNIRYYTGFTSSECMVLLTRKACYLITDFRYTIQARAETAGAASVIEVNARHEQYDTLRGLLQQDGCTRCGFEQEAVTVAQFEKLRAFPLEWRAFGAEINAPRRIKSADEIALLRRAQGMADAAFSRLIDYIRPGRTEREVKAQLNALCEQAGSEGPSFDPIVGAGENGAMCHAVPGERALQKGDLVVIDFGCTCGGYRSDMTRTVAIGGVGEELRRVYDVVLETQLLCLDALHGGISGRALHMLAQDNIAKYGYGDCFGHGLGHGFGLQIHEPPRASATSEDTLESGMTVTVEPGVYLEGKGGVRIEDCVVVTDGGCINLVSAAKDLLII